MKKLIISSLAIALLSGCGSDSAPEIKEQDTVKEPDSADKAKYVTQNIKPDAKLGDFYVHLGRYDDRVHYWLLNNMSQNPLKMDRPREGGPDVDLNDDGWLDSRDAHLAGIYNPEKKYIKINAQDMHNVLMTNPDGLGAGTARPDIFVPGHYSAFDALRYLAVTRDDLKLENVISPEESGRDTYEFEVSWDRNQDGEFDERDNNIYSNYKSKDWHFRWRFDGGNFTRTNGTTSGIGPQGEVTYNRLDQTWIQTGMSIRLQPFSPEMTARRRFVQDREMMLKAAAGGKVIVPKMMFNFVGMDRAPTSLDKEMLILDNVEVTAHNMRPDIFQPGVITIMDAFLSVADLGYDVKFNWWPTLSTEAPIDHFALWRVDGVASDVGRGWATAYMDPVTALDFGNYTKCDFSSPSAGGMDIEVDPTHCQLDWATTFGGWATHQMSDVWVMNEPIGLLVGLIKSHYDTWGMQEYSGKDTTERDFSDSADGSDIRMLQVFDLPQEGPVLNSSHFGWGIADCTECHNEEKDPNGHGGHTWPINSSDGFEETQPHYCATCHGSNGAPMGHEETARCFWCHDAEPNRPKHHGDASTSKFWKDDRETLKGNLAVYNKLNRPNALPLDGNGNYSAYSIVQDSINNDWNMSKIFPDPYSCMTCHPNQ